MLDCLLAYGQDLREQPLRKRKEKLKRLLKGHPRLLYVDHLERDELAMFTGALALGLEGIVAKDAKSPYVEGPRVTWHWRKIKNKGYQRQEKIEFHPRKIT